MAAPRKSKIEQCLEDFGAAIDQHQEMVQEGFTALIAAYDAIDAAVKNGIAAVAPPAATARPVARPAPAPATATRRPAPPVVEDDDALSYEPDEPTPAPRRPGRPAGSTNRPTAPKPVGRPAAAPVGRPRRPAPEPEPEEFVEDDDLGFDGEEAVTSEDETEDWEKEWVEEPVKPTTRRPAAR